MEERVMERDTNLARREAETNAEIQLKNAKITDFQKNVKENKKATLFRSGLQTLNKGLFPNFCISPGGSIS